MRALLQWPGPAVLCAREGGERPYAAVGTFRDVTRQRAGQLALVAWEAHFRLLAENAGDLITRLTVAGICTYASPAARDLFSKDPEELLGDWRNSAAVHPDDLPAFAVSHQRLVEHAEPYTLGYRAPHREGRWIRVVTVSRPVTGPDGTVVEIQSATRDITARIEQE
ncbi:MAG: domain S-box, partial [Frankiales bacterium]|nr:domain S-box [Frankiales bacterium]